MTDKQTADILHYLRQVPVLSIKEIALLVGVADQSVANLAGRVIRRKK